MPSLGKINHSKVGMVNRIGTLLYMTVQFMLVGALLYHVPLRHLGICIAIVVVILVLAITYWLFHPRFVALDQRTQWEQENFKLRENLNSISTEHMLDRILLLEYVEHLAQRFPTVIYKHFDARKTRVVIDQGLRKLEFDWFTSDHRIFLNRLESYTGVTVVTNANSFESMTDRVSAEQDAHY